MKNHIFRSFLAAALTLSLAAGLSATGAGAYDANEGTAGHRNFADMEMGGFLDSDGGFWIYGAIGDGQIGNLTAVDRVDSRFKIDDDNPIKLVMEDVVAFSGTRVNAAVLKKDGSLWMWGRNAWGQLGFDGGNATDGSETYQTVPVKVMDNVAAVSSGAYHTAAIKTDGTLWTWGCNHYGALGNGEGAEVYSGKPRLSQSTPVKVLDDVVAVSCGSSHTAAIRSDGSLWTWGQNSFGALGNGLTGNDSSSAHLWQNVPVKVMDGAASVSCGDGTTAVVKTDGSLWMFGNNHYGAVGGYNAFAAAIKTPIQTVPLHIMDDVLTADTSGTATVALKQDGSLWGWGGIGTGGMGPDAPSGTNTPVKLMDGVAAAVYNLALKPDDSAWTWGYSGAKQIDYLKDFSFRLPDGAGAQTPPSSGMASASAVPVSVDETTVEFRAYALTDGTGGVTNYLRLRDVALALNGTAAQFDVGWDGSVMITPQQPYTGTPSGSVPFSGDQPYRRSSAPTKINDTSVDLEAIILTDQDGNDYTYYRLRDLGKMLDFNVTWQAETGITIHTAQSYSND